MSKCWYCNNELTSGDSPKHFGICNKCYDEMFKSSDTIISSFTNKISDLEAKLADIEESAVAVIDANFKIAEENQQLKQLLCLSDSNKVYEKYFELKQQLAEKDKEIERLNLEFETQEDWQEKWQKLYDETCNLNQDKISFAVEQLTLFKNSIVNKMNNPYSVNIKHILSDFDNQIKELKKGVD